MSEKKFYWLKFSKDFFKDHKIKIIEKFPNGEKYLLFYIKLMAESVSHEGRLRFSDAIPYNEMMLSAVTDTDIDVVHSAIEVLKTLQLVQIFDDETLYLTQVTSIIGSEGESAARVRAFRERERAKAQEALQCNDNVTDETHNVTESIENRDLSLNNILPIAHARVENGVENVEMVDPNRPAYSMVIRYIEDNGLKVDPRSFRDYYDLKGWPVDWRAKARTWDSFFRQSSIGKAVVESEKRTIKEYLDEIAARIPGGIE